VAESLYPSTPDDWLIVAGDVGERTDEIRWSLDLLRKRFAKVIWVPGNHELWTTGKDPVQVFGRSRYDYLVQMCDEMGVITPEHPFPVWTEEGGPATIVPMFLLYDYTFLPAGANSKAEGLGIAKERNVVGHRRVSCCPRSRTPPRTPGAGIGWSTPASASKTWTG
jgi:3',5'-cyclic AMP phosphodiesterase CpdA